MVEVSHLTLRFNSELIFDGFYFSANAGDKIAVTGKSGRGKSSLLNLLAGFIVDYEGEIKIFDKKLCSENISEIRKNIAWLPQEVPSLSRSVRELFFEPFGFVLNKRLRPSDDDIFEVFSEFELDINLLDKKTNEISGGQKQRIMLAGCILLKKPLLLLDEPTSALDEKLKIKITDYILNKRDITVISATHDEYWIKKSDKVVELGY